MIVTIVSCFRQATAYIPRYFDQVGALAVALAQRGDKLVLVLGYGDSTDGTGEMLFEEAMFSLGTILVDVSHGGEHYGSIEHPERFKQLAYVGNKLLDAVPADSDVVIIVESDLIWSTKTMLAVIDDLEHVPAVAPMIMHQSDPGLYKGDGPFFYDTFAFRRNGVQFTNESPYHADLLTNRKRLLQVDSAGSVLAIRGELARQARFTEKEVIVGYCKDICQRGGEIYADTTQAIHHP